eukprot:gene10783-biopygen1763
MFATAILAYHALVLVLFGGLGLVLFPMRVLHMSGVQGDSFPEEQLRIYRICGLWVMAAGMVSGYAAASHALHWPACLLFAAVHSTETIIKMNGVGWAAPAGHKFRVVAANGHLLILLSVAAAFC